MAPVSQTTVVEESDRSWDASVKGAASRLNKDRLLLVLSTSAALAGAVSVAPSPMAIDPDLLRLMRFMALLKGAFAIVALILSYWRLGRPSAAWREVVYIVGPGAMAAGAFCLWTLQSAGFAALGLHVGLFALLAAGLTDDAFIPPPRRRA